MSSTPSRELRERDLLADDAVLLGEGVASLLETSGFEAVGQAGTEPR